MKYDTEAIRARAEKDSPRDLGVDFVRVLYAFVGSLDDYPRVTAALRERGFTRDEAAALVSRYHRYTWELQPDPSRPVNGVSP